MRTVLLLLVSIGVCLCAVQASVPAPSLDTSTQSATTPVIDPTPTVSKAPSLAATVTARATTGAPTMEVTARTTAPTATMTKGPSLQPTASRTATPSVTPQASRTRTPAPRPTDIETTSRTSSPTPSPTRSTPVSTTVVTTITTTPPSSPLTTVSTTAPPTPVLDPNLTPVAPNETFNGWSPIVPGANETLNATFPTPWPLESVTPYPTPTDTPDIDPGMTPYTGPTASVTPTDVIPSFDPNATLTLDPALIVPVFTAEVVSSPPFEIPPGMLEIDAFPSPTETFEPVPSLPGPDDPGASSFLPRWIGYLLFVFLGIAGVAGLALVGTYLGGRTSSSTSSPPREVTPISSESIRPLLLAGTSQLPIDQQILVDRIAGFSPATMPVERLGRNLLRLEQAVQERTGDRSIRLGRLLHLASVPSLEIPPGVSIWARIHGFRVLAIDGSGTALVMPDLSSISHSELGILPVSGMYEGSSPVPMPVLPPEGGPSTRVRSSFLSGMGYYSPVEPSE